MKALVFAAGLGTRLKPLTDSIPKALVPVGGKPLIVHVVEKLKNAGIDDVTVNVHHFADMIADYVEQQNSFGIKVNLSFERELLLETGGGIAHARKFLEGEPFIIHNVDILSNLDIDWFVRQSDSTALVNLLVSERETQRYLLFNESMDMVGWTNVATGEVRSPYVDLDVNKCRKLAFAGFHLVSDRIFDVFVEDEWPERFPVMDFYIRECARHRIRGVCADDLRMVDVGKLDTLAKAEEFLQSLQ